MSKKGLMKDIKMVLKKKKRKRGYGRERYKNIPRDEKQKLAEQRNTKKANICFKHLKWASSYQFFFQKAKNNW